MQAQVLSLAPVVSLAVMLCGWIISRLFLHKFWQSFLRQQGKHVLPAAAKPVNDLLLLHQ